MKEALYVLGDVVHALQRERGCTAIFLYSQGELFLERMLFQFKESDRALLIFQEAVERWKKRSPLKQTDINELLDIATQCRELPQPRANITKRKMSVSDSISLYSHELIGPILQLMVGIALNMKDSNPTQVSAYNAFLQWKEKIGLERAIGARGFIKNSFQNKEYTERVFFLLGEQENYKNTYFALANEPQKTFVQKALEIDKVFELRRLHKDLKKSSDCISEYNLSPEEWYDLVSAKIDALHSKHKELVDGLFFTKEVPVAKKVATPETSSALSGTFGTLISSLQLFSGISPQDMKSLLQSAQIREFEKGKLVFLEGEPANRLYIVLKGWVRAFKGTIHGEETILQMLTAGEAIMESAVFLNAPFPVCCQVVEDAIILSIPAPVIREQIKNNNELAMNLLATMSHRSQGLIRQIENARLKSADERVGWFLLKLMLQQGRLSRCVELPYDKSLIASYLDMKRETFSRALKRLKEKGFKIENDTVVIPDMAALCNYCDSSLASECALHGEDSCPNPQPVDESPPEQINPQTRQKII